MPVRKRPSSAGCEQNLAHHSKRRYSMDVPSAQSIHLIVLGIGGKIVEKEVDSTLTVVAVGTLISKELDLPRSCLRLMHDSTPIKDSDKLHFFASRDDRSVTLSAVACLDLVSKMLQSKSERVVLHALRDVQHLCARGKVVPLDAICDCCIQRRHQIITFRDVVIKKKISDLAFSTLKSAVNVEGVDRQPAIDWVLK
eukprot:gnl/MRDRNA2_/MRDRNA2_357349_c0_seq1.p1 gnl/MRDRNA2_/MRDRNA2_357349_c0~~gnl/MRDRNA2_/MRDRNA2_357349_c0_seq1.p1  ORF type:complete len:197 (+),score=31.67 gnl/MRDRNA2_/MRDRNA2_357349_c0_seq1:57-647(+)